MSVYMCVRLGTMKKVDFSASAMDFAWRMVFSFLFHTVLFFIGAAAAMNNIDCLGFGVMCRETNKRSGREGELGCWAEGGLLGWWCKTDGIRFRREKDTAAVRF